MFAAHREPAGPLGRMPDMSASRDWNQALLLA